MDPYGDPTASSARAPRGAWPVARVLGADVVVHWSMVLIPFALVTVIASTYARDNAGDALMWTVAWSLVACAVIWSHSYAHLWAGGDVAAGSATVVLSPLAPIVHDGRHPHDARAALRTALAGPAVHVVWMALAYPMWLMLDPDSAGAQMVIQFAFANLALGAANLLPFHPMDGGRVLRAALTPSIGAARAEAWTASAGYGGAVTLGLAGLTILARFGVEQYGGWAIFIVAIGVLTLTASQRALFAAQFRAHSERLAPPPAEAEPPVPDYLDEQALARMVDPEGASKREETVQVVESAEDRRQRLQERIDALLDRINEVGGMDGLSADERRELAEASELLRRETADG